MVHVVACPRGSDVLLETLLSGLPNKIGWANRGWGNVSAMSGDWRVWSTAADLCACYCSCQFIGITLGRPAERMFWHRAGGTYLTVKLEESPRPCNVLHGTLSHFNHVMVFGLSLTRPRGKH